MEDVMFEPQVWTIAVNFTSEEGRTRADAVLTGAPDELRGVGWARRNPDDPDVPAIGHELATARALADLSHHLMEQVARRIEDWQGKPAHVSQ